MKLKTQSTMKLDVLHPDIDPIPTRRKLELAVFIVDIRGLGSLAQICALNITCARPRTDTKNRARGLGVHAAPDVREEKASFAEDPFDVDGCCWGACGQQVQIHTVRGNVMAYLVY